jgi:molecular chaperone DnaK
MFGGGFYTLRAGADGAAPGADHDSATGADGKKEDVVDAEFTEVDDDKNNKKSA